MGSFKIALGVIIKWEPAFACISDTRPAFRDRPTDCGLTGGSSRRGEACRWVVAVALLLVWCMYTPVNDQNGHGKGASATPTKRIVTSRFLHPS